MLICHVRVLYAANKKKKEKKRDNFSLIIIRIKLDRQFFIYLGLPKFSSKASAGLISSRLGQSEKLRT